VGVESGCHVHHKLVSHPALFGGVLGRRQADILGQGELEKKKFWAFHLGTKGGGE